MCFYNIPKNAMTSVIHSLDFSWRPVADYDYEIFCVLRDPFTRFISAFNETCELYSEGVTTSKCRDITDECLRSILSEPDLGTKCEKYVAELSTAGFFDYHQMPQVFFLNIKRNIVRNFKLAVIDRDVGKVHHFLRFEHLDDDIKKIAPVCLPRLNKSSSIIIDIFKNYESDICKMYTEDFDLYNKHS